MAQRRLLGNNQIWAIVSQQTTSSSAVADRPHDMLYVGLQIYCCVQLNSFSSLFGVYSSMLQAVINIGFTDASPSVR